MVVANPNAKSSVGILQCGEVPESLSHAFIDYNEMIARSLIAADPTLTCRTWRVFEGEIPESDECDAWITTGSRHSVNDEDDWTEQFCDFVKVAAERELSLIHI